MTLQDRIRRNTEAFADRPAIEAGGSVFPWSAVAAIGASLEQLCTDLGLGPDAPIGLVSRNRAPTVAALFALMAHGRPVVMISPAQTPERMADDLGRLRVALILGEAEDWTPPVVAAATALGCAAATLPALPQMPIAVVPGLDRIRLDGVRFLEADAAVELPTSGTTGVPKRVVYTRRTLDLTAADVVDSVVTALDDLPPDRPPPWPIIQYYPLPNISGFYFCLMSGWSGQQLVLLERFTVDSFVEAVVRHRPAMAWLLPTAVRMLLDAEVPVESLRSIRTVRSGSAPLEPETIRRFEARYGFPILQHYGATEYCGVIADWTLEEWRRDPARGHVSVGHARPGIGLRVVDAATGEGLPPGDTGMLEIRVPRIAPDWIRTNDLAILDAAGFLFLRGRADEAINRGGFKVLPEMVAEALRRHPGVKDAVVIPLADARLGEVPVACIERQPGAALSEADLDAFARRELLAYQIPQRFLILDAIPRTPNLKPHRPALRALFEEPSQS